LSSNRFSPPAGGLRHAAPSIAWPFVGFYALLIVYASLYPFTGWRNQGIVPWAYLWAPWPRYWTAFDFLVNVAGYAPFGFMLALALMRRRPAWRAAILAGAAATLLSFTMESMQSYLPERVASNVDFSLNAAGGILGAGLAWVFEQLGFPRRWQSARSRWFLPGSRAVLVLLALWLVALLFPTPVAFGAGQIYEQLESALLEWLADTPFLNWLPVRKFELQPLRPLTEAACVALGALAPCLLGCLASARRRHKVALVALILAAGVGVSALSTALSWGPAYSWAWITAPVIVGWPLALLGALLLALLPLPRAWYAVLLVAALLLQLYWLNGASQSPYFASTLQSWEQGQFIHFFGLTRWVNGAWPYAAVVFAATRAFPQGHRRFLKIPT
jgi:VanZ family protein